MDDSVSVNFPELFEVMSRLVEAGELVQATLEWFERFRVDPDFEQSMPLSEDTYWAVIRASEPVRASMIALMNEMRSVYWAARGIAEGFAEADAVLAARLSMLALPTAVPAGVGHGSSGAGGGVFGPRIEGSGTRGGFSEENPGPEAWLRLGGKPGVVDSMVPGAMVAGAGLLLASGVLATAGWALSTAFEVVGRAMAGAVVDAGVKDVVLAEVVGASLDGFLEDWKESFRPEAVVGAGYSGVEWGLGMLGERYEAILDSFPEALGKYGLFPEGFAYVWRDPGWRPDVVEILNGDAFNATFRETYLSVLHRMFGKDYQYAPTAPISDARGLLLRLGEIDAVGSKDAALVQTVINEGPPKSMIVLIPSTQEWNPTEGSRVPNDLKSNLQILGGGESDLLFLVEGAIRAKLDELPEGERDQVEIMTAGFSQGGIVAAQIAQRANFNVTQVFTAGAPVGRILEQMPAGINVVALEQPRDPIPKLDGRVNPQRPGMLTYVPEQDGLYRGETSTPMSHDVLRYARIAEDLDGSEEAVKSMRKFMPGTVQEQTRFEGKR